MQVHRDIEALRSNPASQRRCAGAMKAALAAWHAKSEVAALSRELAAYSASGSLDDCASLSRLVTDHANARTFVESVTRQFTAALREEPLGEVPFRRSSGDGFSRVQLLQSGGAVLSICAFEAREWSGDPETVQFVDGAAHEIIVAGAARGKIYRREGEAILQRNGDWRAGDVIVRQPSIHARHVLGVERSLLVLQLTRVSMRPGPSCEYKLSDGTLVRQTSGNKRASEQVMALGVLGALGASGTAVPMAVFARDQEQDTDARWEAVRQLLALDAGEGFDLLCELSCWSDDALAAPARRLREQLEQAHPVLRARNEETV